MGTNTTVGKSSTKCTKKGRTLLLGSFHYILELSKVCVAEI